ncbi:MAG: ABC transporter substrate-binding protein [Spirochaetaceae bacterium]|jgi:iron complex transport system substrate-binding protein|nr:ABC transporter substrate-binding protein [Spirochaetaceae bacterium]
MKKIKYSIFGAKALLVFMALICVFAASCARKKPVSETATRVWSDSLGREVTLPVKIERIAPSGPLAQIILYSLCPDRIIGWSNSFSEEQKRYIPQKYWDKPTFGQFYGRNVTMNLEAVIAAKPDLLIDLGEAKPNIHSDMDGLSAQIGIPVVFIEATLETMSGAYRALGDLLGEEKAAAELAAYIDETFEYAAACRAAIPEKAKLSVYMGEGKGGLRTNAQGSVHSDVIDYAGGVNAVDFNHEPPGGMQPVSLEQVFIWNPDVIILGAGASTNEVKADPGWQALPAVQKGRVYDIPQQPWNWVGRPPSINRLIGIKWLGNLLYPDIFKCDINAEAKRFYRLFYHAEY